MAKPKPINLVIPIMDALEQHVDVCDRCAHLEDCQHPNRYCLDYIEAVMRGEEPKPKEPTNA